ncbi:MAG: hypothetical protein MOP51_2105 [Citricoccus sp.]|nr:hypothetical protein [Citricoccus sp. WCRC_4]
MPGRPRGQPRAPPASAAWAVHLLPCPPRLRPRHLRPRPQRVFPTPRLPRPPPRTARPSPRGTVTDPPRPQLLRCADAAWAVHRWRSLLRPRHRGLRTAGRRLPSRTPRAPRVTCRLLRLPPLRSAGWAAPLQPRPQRPRRRRLRASPVQGLTLPVLPPASGWVAPPVPAGPPLRPAPPTVQPRVSAWEGHPPGAPPLRPGTRLVLLPPRLRHPRSLPPPVLPPRAPPSRRVGQGRRDRRGRPLRRHRSARG